MKSRLPRAPRGAALLIMVSIIMVALTTVAVSRLSLNRLHTDRQVGDRQLLQAAHDAIVGYSYLKVLNSDPSLTLPCPDTDEPPNGIANNNCNQTGALPYQNFSQPERYDSGSRPIQYEVSGGPSFTCPPNQPDQIRVTLQTPSSQPDPLRLEIRAHQLCPPAAP